MTTDIPTPPTRRIEWDTIVLDKDRQIQVTFHDGTYTTFPAHYVTRLLEADTPTRG